MAKNNDDRNGNLATAEAGLLENVCRLIEAGEPQNALAAIAKAGLVRAELINARAVCHLRLGDPKKAIEILRPHVFGAGMSLRTDVPAALHINFATALLLDGNLSGCKRVLNDLKKESHPGVQQLRAAIEKWRGGLSFWLKLSYSLGSDPVQPIPLDFAPGTLDRGTIS